MGDRRKDVVDNVWRYIEGIVPAAWDINTFYDDFRECEAIGVKKIHAR